MRKPILPGEENSPAQAYSHIFESQINQILVKRTQIAGMYKMWFFLHFVF